ncbi:MAG: NADH:ubiquinone oxidoreductase [Candidatus Schekmanbacteria bacterium]|nr:NADH:ubiquinone oxidoreductase [Candidatus Schekmanbacteria bacterium]
MAFLSAESPDLPELLDALDIELLWHPSLSALPPRAHAGLVERIKNGEQRLDILVVEGAVIRGPAGTGMYHAAEDNPRKNTLVALARKANIVVALGTCACFGGIGVDTEIQSTGLQYQGRKRGGILGEQFLSGKGLPVINLAGCPCHHDVIASALYSLATGQPLELDEYQRPLEWYGLLVHQGCTRNEYHEYRVEEEDFGEVGCMFFHLGCHGPLVPGPCNKLLWSRRSSKTRVGAPCLGCTDPDFPPKYAFFETRNTAGIPTVLPWGMNRAHYLAYKGMAAAAAPERLKKRLTRI